MHFTVTVKIEPKISVTVAESYYRVILYHTDLPSRVYKNYKHISKAVVTLTRNKSKFLRKFLHYYVLIINSTSTRDYKNLLETFANFLSV